jgi:hypothetical protein
MRMGQTPAPLLWGALLGRVRLAGKHARLLGAAQRQRLTAAPLPSYWPDDKPMASLGKQPKQRATQTHKKDGNECAALTGSVKQALVFEPQIACAQHWGHCQQGAT